MPDADVIPLGGRGEPGRGSSRQVTPSSASRSLAPRPPRGAVRPTPRRVDAGDSDAAPSTAAPEQSAASPSESGSAERPPAAPGTRVPQRSASPDAAEGTPRATRARQPVLPRRPAGGPGYRAPAASRRIRPVSTKPPTPPPEEPGGSPLVEVARFIGELAERVLGEDTQRRVIEALALLRRRLTGEFEVDPFGFDRELTEGILLPLLRPLYSQWFRVEVRGVSNLPAEGGALVVANHSGTVALDSLMTQLAVHDEHPAHRHLRMLGADMVFRMPFVGELARKGGSTLACTDDALRLLSSGEIVGVWPEGFKGIGKPFQERYKLQRFGRGGFVSAALRTSTPIVPCSIVGAEEIYPMIANMPTLARVLGLPYLPVTPTFPWLGPLGLIPLPSKWIIEFGEPIRTDGYPEGAADDPMLVFNLTDQVRETIQQTLYALLVSRRRTFL